jgi:hypothetical protein
MQKHYLERVLFIVGNRHCGKSTQPRSMFRDVRLGTAGRIPIERKFDDFLQAKEGPLSLSAIKFPARTD